MKMSLDFWCGKLASSNPFTRLNAVRALAAHGLGAAVAVPYLVTATADNDSRVRDVALAALRDLGLLPSAVPGLIRQLGTLASLDRESAAHALGQVGPQAASAIPALREAFRDDDPSVRIEAALALWLVSGESQSAVRVLREALQDPAEFSSRDPHLLFVESLGSRDLVEETRRRLAAYVRDSAGEALERIDADAARKAGLA